MGCAGRGHRAMAYRGRGMKDSGTLIVAAAPLGQPADASPRLAGALAAAGIVAAEDTRRALRLARELGVKITGRLISYYNAVEQDRVDTFAKLTGSRVNRDDIVKSSPLQMRS